MHPADLRNRPALLRARFNYARAQMDLVIEEVSDTIDRRVDANIKEAKKVANIFRDLGDVLVELMKIDVAKIESAPSFFATCDAIRLFAATVDAFEQVFETYVAEHGTLLETAAQANIRAFVAWARKQPSLLARLCEERSAQYSAGLKETSRENPGLLSELASLRGDRWPGDDDAS